MLDILKNFDSAEKGESTSTQDTGGMKAILESFNAVSEAPVPAIPSQMPPAAMPPQEPQGQPVTMNVSLNASGKDHVDDLLSLMQSAGLSGAKQLDKGDGILDVDMDGDHQPDLDINSDMSKLRSIIADPKEESMEEGVVSDMKLSPEMQEKVKNASDKELYQMAFGSGDDSLRAGDDFEMLKKARAELRGQAESFEFGSEPRKSPRREPVKYDRKQSMPSIMKYAYQPDVSNALAAAAGVDSEEVYFDDADLVYGDETVVPRCGVDDDCTFGDAVEALKDFAKNNPVEKKSSENVEINSIRKNAGLDVQEAGEDTATSVAQELKKMGVSEDASDDEIYKNIGAALKSLDLESVLNMMNMSKDYRSDMVSDILNNFRGMSEWANSPQGSEGDEEYKDAKYMYKDLSGGLNREKKAYAAAQDGDNAMAVESIKSQLLKALAEKMDPVGQEDDDVDNDGEENTKSDKYLKNRRAAIAKATAEKGSKKK